MGQALKIFLLSFVLCLPVAAQTPRVVSASADDIALTIYRDNLAFVTETRTVEVPAGRSTIAFEGVSDLLIPQTAILREFGAVTLERNFDYDLLSQGSLLDNYVGKKVFLTRTNPATGSPQEVEATLVSAGQGAILNIDGQIEVFDCSGLPEKISFPEVPESLIAQPTLSIEVSAESAGLQEFTISYLASGFDWQADYVLRLDGDQRSGDLSGWLTLTNGTAVSVANAPTAIVAGELQRLWETRAERRYADGFYATCWPRGSTKTGANYNRRRYEAKRGAPVPVALSSRSFAEAESLEEDSVVVTGSRLAQREDLGDYKLFRTPEPTTVAAYQTKQVAFLNQDDVSVTPIHAFSFEPGDYSYWDETDEMNIEAALIRYDIDNSKDGALAQPLPKGTVRVFTPDDQEALFYLGEDDIRDLAVGLPVEIETANSPSVSVVTRVTNAQSRDVLGNKTRHTVAFQHTVTNANGYLITAEISQNKEGYVDAPTISGATRRKIQDSVYPKWQFDVAPNSQATLSYTMIWTD